MKTAILAAFIIIGLASCSLTQPNERGYYPQQRIYSTSPYYQVDPFYNPAYDYRYNRPYNDPYYDPYYNNPGYYNRRNYRREPRRENNVRREYRYNQPADKQQMEQPGEKRLPDGTRISSDGTVTLPNGEVRRKQ